MNKLINYEDKIFVAGHNGMVGKAVCRSLRKYGYHNIITCDRSNLDLANSKAVDEYKAVLEANEFEEDKDYPRMQLAAAERCVVLLQSLGRVEEAKSASAIATKLRTTL